MKVYNKLKYFPILGALAVFGSVFIGVIKLDVDRRDLSVLFMMLMMKLIPVAFICFLGILLLDSLAVAPDIIGYINFVVFGYSMNFLTAKTAQKMDLIE